MRIPIAEITWFSQPGMVAICGGEIATSTLSPLFPRANFEDSRRPSFVALDKIRGNAPLRLMWTLVISGRFPQCINRPISASKHFWD